MTTVIDGLDQLREQVGSHLGFSDWMEITQECIDLFAEATGDHQWIHVDPEKAKDGPFGTTIAHGYLTLSLGPDLAAQIYEIKGFSMAVNYGSGKIRFPAPVPVGSMLRMGAELKNVEELPDGKVQITVIHTFEVDGASKPSCVAEIIFRAYP